MATNSSQNRTLAAEDWTRIYQSFKNADFQSYDFDNLRRTMIGYLRENYPEDFNDYIESSEYLALVDLIAFLGQNLAFRFDLNSRDNFLELAERRESVLRLARLLSYNPKRCLSANGLLKITSLTTTESVIDSNGRDIANRTVLWNDASNPNWYEQFIKALNSAFPASSQFGKPIDSATISGVPTEQYRFNATNTEVPVYSFNKSVDGRNMVFEVVSSKIKDGSEIVEEDPFPGRSPAILYRDDGGGAASSNSGFFMHFREGTLQESTFNITRPGTAEIVDIDSININNDDVWLYGLDSVGVEQTLWTKVSATTGNNVIYNSVSKNIRKIYSVLTKSNDRIRLIFSDGVFGDLPQGNFKVYYRISNGQTYSINPTDIKNITIDIPYLSKANKQEIMTVTLGLFYSVKNSAASESSTSIKQNAPAVYYTQNRMITGEDYNILPLSVNQEIIKIKAVNRVSSGISRYFDLRDSSGKYSNTSLFGTDGILIKETYLDSFTFSYSSRSDIENLVANEIEKRLSSRPIIDFYFNNFPSVNLSGMSLRFYQQTLENNLSTGYIRDENNELKKVGPYTTSLLQYFVPNAMVKFVPPAGKLFSATGKLINATNAPASAKKYIWTKIVTVVGDGTANGIGLLANGHGPVKFNDIIPTDAIIDSLIPKFVTSLDSTVRLKVIDLIFSNRNFGLRYSQADAAWQIITESNINTLSNFSLAGAGNKTNENVDASWILLFETDGELYKATCRGVKYIFESEKEIRFFYNSAEKVYDTATGTIVKDKITILGINPIPNESIGLAEDYHWEIIGEYIDDLGYVDTSKVLISFYDSDNDGVIDDPEKFSVITEPTTGDLTKRFVYQLRTISATGDISYSFVDNSNDLILSYQTQTLAYAAVTAGDILTGQLVHIVEKELIYKFDGSTFIENSDYIILEGRSNLKFHYTHAANESSRLDPATTNIIDVFLLSKTYDIEYRRWVQSGTGSKPLPPTSDDLYINFGQFLNQSKAISDEIIYHPVKYKNIFGSSAESSVQATFKVIKNSSIVVSDTDIKAGVIEAINEFFDIENWSFGDTFYFSELSTYIMNKLVNKIVNIIIVPKQSNLSFGSLYEIKSNSNEIFISSATVDDVEIISEITESKIKSSGILI